MRTKLASWPPVYLDDTLTVNGNNNPFRIVMHPDAPAWIAVYAQERREWPLRWLEVLVQLTIVGFFFRRRLREWIEELGHAAEIAVRVLQYGESYEAADADEARSMLDPDSSYRRKGLWAGMSVADMCVRLKARRDGAARWVARHGRHLRRINDAYTAVTRPA